MGDRVVIYLPMVPEAAIAMLACARLGAVQPVVFGGFAAAELAARIDDATPKVVVSAFCGIEPARIVPYKPLLDEALALSSHDVDAVVILQRPQFPAEMGPKDWDWAASDVGWVVGHSYIVYAPLLAGATTVLYEGKPVGTSDAGAFGRVISEPKVTAMFTAPTAMRAIRKEDPTAALMTGYDLTSLQALYLAGERLDLDTYQWCTQTLGVPVIDNWWQTETGWPIAANPLPPGTLPTLWQDDRRYIESYLAAFDGYYTTGDGGFINADGYLHILGRTDDVINVAGHRPSTGAMEAVVAAGADATADEVSREVIASVRSEIGPVAALKSVVMARPARPLQVGRFGSTPTPHQLSAHHSCGQ